MGAMHPLIKAGLRRSNALILGPLAAWLLVWLLMRQTQVPAGSKAFQYVQTFAVLFMVLCNYMGWWLFRRQLKVVKTLGDKQERVAAFVKASDGRFVLYFLALVNAVVAYSVTLHWSLSALVWTQAVLMFLQRPHPWVAAAHLGLHRSELFQGPA